MFGEDPAITWLIVGAILLAIEAFGVPGIGFLFAGLAAMVVGIVVQAGWIAVDDLVLQGAVFFIATTALGVLLWKRMKAWRMNPTQKEYNNMVGDIAVVAKGGLKKGARGEAVWSGTTMKAEIADDEPAEAFEAGAQLRIASVEGIVLKLKK